MRSWALAEVGGKKGSRVRSQGGRMGTARAEAEGVGEVMKEDVSISFFSHSPEKLSFSQAQGMERTAGTENYST